MSRKSRQQCPDCGSSVSNDIEKCPSCGALIQIRAYTTPVINYPLDEQLRRPTPPQPATQSRRQAFRLVFRRPRWTQNSFMVILAIDVALILLTLFLSGSPIGAYLRIPVVILSAIIAINFGSRSQYLMMFLYSFISIMYTIQVLSTFFGT